MSYEYFTLSSTLFIISLMVLLKNVTNIHYVLFVNNENVNLQDYASYSTNR